MASTNIDWTQVQFTKSSYSGTDQGNCVELAALPGIVGLRDSKLGSDSPVLEFTERGFQAFLLAVKAESFDRRR
ncbi:DUF397 domain-containing protein [Saccharopolyspora hirsuta]|uniref:DUF397 domain-containing protein n=1 Tax=Saccharopolyspora hirsuta TaxID=1837 RepID=A0A5M7BDI4_SACHI|nr:DUF397 domain-containing protein [Saccharopolyspora hirsuta]KAA5825461.1 DUF397 domain-containing protein [Saccharopolyspora hirsuta]